MSTIKQLLQNPLTLLDGGMGTMLQQKGMPLGTIPETLNVTRPDWIIDIHRQYIAAGSQIIYANTFGANRHKLADSGYSVPELIQAAIHNAGTAAEGTETLVALDIGPIGQLLEPTGALSFEEAYGIFMEMVTAGRDAGADLVIIETMTDLYETKAAVLAAKENSELPIFVTMTFEENMRTFTGCSVSAMCLTMEGLGVDALGVNCSLGPRDLIPIVEEIHRWTSLPIIVKPNAGLPDPVTNEYNVLPDEFAEVTKQMLPFGVRILGGCCGTNPEFIKKLSEMIRSLPSAAEQKGMNIPTETEDGSKKTCSSAKDPVQHELAVCTPLRTVAVNEPRIIGERINPTGKKRFRQALLDGDMDYILSQAVEQVEAGADILDVNVGAPGIDEKEMMVKTIKAIQSVIDVPLQIDSTKPEVIEAALRVYNGKPIVNSVNGEEAVMERILPLIAKYGASIVCLTLDENGIPKTADGRFEIARKIMERALSYGIKKENILIDCLVLTVSAEQGAAMETLKALHRVKTELGLKTVLGVSNISFGLPNRLNINTSFLTMALYAGLDLPIMNPNLSAMMWAFKSYKVLSGDDENSLGFISYSGNHEPDTVQLKKTREALSAAEISLENLRQGYASIASYAGAFANGASAPSGFPQNENVTKTPEAAFVPMLSLTAAHPADCTCESCRAIANAKKQYMKKTDVSASIPESPEGKGILKAMETGMKNDGRRLTARLLNQMDSMAIINNILIPALDAVGEKFEKGKIFLPQLILAADVAKECFDVIKEELAQTDSSSESKGKIILATVKGDIHDIGKNIVKVILENYGYDVIDLGKDVDPQLVLKTAREQDVRLVGLSALMTTTLGSMEETIKLLRENSIDCKIMVGGAVLTEDYALRIGADYYAKDAKTGADIAKKVLHD
ncbi:MAG: homocysteine S-methyltransferase family protein [Lachnospiraceae bacterium]|nr:homocysteine S-methyltransferase family protein [Lachnospiraceae bacterium]